MHVISNLATSLDGKIATADRKLFHLGTALDRREMSRLRAHSDVVVFGASSHRVFRRPCMVSGPDAGDLVRQPANALISTSLRGISERWPFYTRPGLYRLLFVGPSAQASVLRRFEQSCEIVQLPPPTARRSTAQRVLSELEKRGLRKVLLEGGGSVMWDFARDNLIDEYHVTITPRILGGTEAPTLVDGVGFAGPESLKLKLESCTQSGDELFLVYRKKPRRKRAV